MLALFIFVLIISGYAMTIRGRGWVVDAGAVTLIVGVLLLAFCR